MTTAKVLWKLIPKTIVALRQKSVMKTVSEEEQISVTTEDSSEEEIDPWSTLINDAASNVRDQYDDILEALLVEGQRYVNNDMFDQDEAIAAAVDKRKFLLKRLLEQ